MAGTPYEYSINEGKCNIEAECDLSSAGAVGATRGSLCTFTKTGVGTYTLRVAQRAGLKLYEVLQRSSDLSGTPAGAFWAKITSVAQGDATDTTPDGGGDILIGITLLSNANPPVASDVTAACTLEVSVVVRTIRNPYTSPI